MKNGFKVMDSDLHTMEPDGLWARYLDEPFKKFAPQFLRGTDNAPNQPVIKIGDLELCEMSKRARTAVVGKELHRRTFERSPHYALAHGRAGRPFPRRTTDQEEPPWGSSRFAQGRLRPLVPRPGWNYPTTR